MIKAPKKEPDSLGINGQYSIKSGQSGKSPEYINIWLSFIYETGIFLDGNVHSIIRIKY
jgi:hypothetical protein